MKTIPLRAGGAHPSKAVLTQVVSLSPEKAIGIDEMRRRCRILDALEKADDRLLLEDADHEILRKAIESFPFQIAHRDILAVVDDVMAAATVPADR
jgi:hypothetical protein